MGNIPLEVLPASSFSMEKWNFSAKISVLQKCGLWRGREGKQKNKVKMKDGLGILEDEKMDMS